jgi:hypothetical protein
LGGGHATTPEHDLLVEIEMGPVLTLLFVTVKDATPVVVRAGSVLEVTDGVTLTA